MVMTLHRLSAGAGYQYLLKHTATGDCDRSGSAPLTAYYTASGNPPGRWLGAGLAGVGGGKGLASGAVVIEKAMANLFGAGTDPVTGSPLGRAYPSFTPARARIASQVADLPDAMTDDARAAAVEAITRVELAKAHPTAVAGFDMTFTPPKSVSTMWAVADRSTQAAVVDAHRAAVDEALAFFERTALFTRTGTAGCQQHPTRGMLAVAFDHWDSRAGDPNLHTHVVVANKVQAPDGRWLSVDSRALHHAVVAISEIYDDLMADELARRLPVSWSWRHRGPRRSPGFEVDGVDDGLMREFSTRTTQIDEAMTATVAEFYATHGRGPNRIEISRLRQQVTRTTRPDKHVHPLLELVATWRRRATDRTGRTPEELTAAVLRSSQNVAMTAAQVPQPVIDHLADHTVTQVMERRSTWTRWNVLAETARATRGLRTASPDDRQELLDRVCEEVLARCVSLEPPELFTVPAEYQRPDGSSVFTRSGEARYTHADVLAAEERLLAATEDRTAPRADTARATAVDLTAPVRRIDGRTVALAGDQVNAIRLIAASGRRLEVLVGPAGTGKTTTLAGLKTVWEAVHGRGAVMGLAPSSAAAAELAEALGITCENTAKWLHESSGPGATLRSTYLQYLTAEREASQRSGDLRRLRTVDTAANNLAGQQQHWTMRPGQLVIVDEASLASTETLDQLTAQSTAAGAKVLLVGDHAQLSAVDAGGAFNLLAERTRPAVLTSLWRFSHRWEADATRALRAGNPAVLDVYAEHDRITAGAAEAMCEAAYTAWQADTENGVPAILLAADAHTVSVLNTRAHNDRVCDGLVAASGITTTDGSVIAVGDRVVTRANNRRLRTRGRFVRNGDLWTVTATEPDGSMAVTRLTGRGEQSGDTVVLPAAYVAQDVDLAYATTTHRAQGLTVDQAHVLAAPGMTRENLYVAMTRGRQDNRVYVAVDDVDPACHYLPDTHAAPDGRTVLAGILATSGAELSATQTIAARQNAAGSLKRLEPIRQTLLADATAPRWISALRRAGLGDAAVEQITTSPACGPLFANLERGAALGAAMDDVLRELSGIRPIHETGEPVGDLAAVLHRRVSAWLAAQVEDPTAITTHPESAHLSPGARDTLRQVDALIEARIEALTDNAINVRSAWLADLEPMPEDDAGRRAWRRQLAAALAHQDFTCGTTVVPVSPRAGEYVAPVDSSTEAQRSWFR
ncbi:MobF family relaxase [Actinotalea sp. Marseille-Q4924]|uniref:MobF family relaxase n=1 Tax=Actinotalea sp. Marseille-Q4924 TaxID=2866571 RepID=UPI001CE4072B|nr:MobF family relaxase [Actinotalea sp. Marseille-Q4924]